jgi:hypothetical protein
MEGEGCTRAVDEQNGTGVQRVRVSERGCSGYSSLRVGI